MIGGVIDHRHPERGYTLIEMVVTVGIFSLAFTAIAAIFIGYTTAQSRASVAQRLLNEGNYILEAITREIRINSIDYACEGWNPATDVDTLCLKAVDGQVTRFEFSADDVNSQSDASDVQVCKDYGENPCGLGSWTTMKPDFMKVERLSFYTFPTVDPATAVSPADPRPAAWQPMVTIVLRVSAGSGRARQVYDLQTAASSRVYAY
jgi:prepilin-type N-terminal cleavage/methylation domain-containing protein